MIFISAEEGKGPLKAVGWYEDAKFESQPIPRPEYKSNPNFEMDDEGRQYKYLISARRAHLIRVDQRPSISIGDHMKRSPILYVRGNNVPEPWRSRLAQQAETLVRKFRSAGLKKRGTTSDARRNGGPWYASKEHKDAVDLAAIQYVKHKLKKQYDVQDRQADKCGYDLLATHNKSRTQLHLEVKGTSMEKPGFFMTLNELTASESPKCRLAMVTNALTKPRCQLIRKRDVRRLFDVKPCSYVATLKSND